MEGSNFTLSYEKKRLDETVALASKQLQQAIDQNEENKTAILEAKKEMRENTTSASANLYGSDAFEALAALSQYANPITDKIADYEATENKIAVLENMIKSPYFARIDFQFEGEDTPEEIYIGRASLMKDNAYDIYVYDWRSPVASVFYRFMTGEAFYDAPGGRVEGNLSLKRQYEIVNSNLEYYFDADVQIVDEFLRKLLSHNTSNKMKSIIETIQKEQDVVIRDMETELMMVQGVAGSGKTSIALHRAAYLMYQGLSVTLAASNILIISPNTLFEQYISNVLPELGESNIASEVFEELAARILKTSRMQSRNQFLERLISDHTRYQNIRKSSIEFKTSQTFQEILDRFIEDLPHRWISFEDVYYDGRFIIGKEALKERIISGKNETTCLGMRLKLLENYIIGLIEDTTLKRLKRWEKLEIRESLYGFTRLSLIEHYKTLFQKKDYFYELTDGIALPEQIKEILSYTRENLYGDTILYDDITALLYLQLQVNGTTAYKNIKQVVIDEAQDYYPLQFEVFHLLFHHAKFTILGDINQTLEKREDLTLYEEIKKIFGKKNASLVTLDKSFRCTSEILNYGARFLDKTMDIKSFNRQGEMPEVYGEKDQAALHRAIIAEVKKCQEKGYQSVGLICKTEQNAVSLFQHLKDRLDIQLIRTDGESDLQGVFIIPVYMSKGLEFDAVLVCDADEENYYSEDDKKLLYIAATRALHRLNLFCAGKVSPLL